MYYIAVDGVNGANGTVRLHYSLATVPQFTVQALSQTAAAGATVTLNVTANGSPTVAYQWRCNGTNLVGATNASLTIINFQAANSGAYTVVATTSAGSTTEYPAP